MRQVKLSFWLYNNQFLLLCLTRYLTSFFVLLALQGCFGGGQYAPVVERKERLSVAPKTYSVSKGETLYSIAWLYNMDFRGLASTNNISAPYTIYPGQVIRLSDQAKTAKVKNARQQPIATTKPIGSNGSSTKASRQSSPPQVRDNKQKTMPVGYPFRWQWPGSKKISKRFTSASALHKGIDIQGNLGEPVLAANSGKVVYAGSGLVGFGNLLIIKHNENYLSAYGHNSKLLVAEGSLVKVGQKIAEFGDSGTDKVKLHFQIRRNGKPVNPIKLLPK